MSKKSERRQFARENRRAALEQKLAQARAVVAETQANFEAAREAVVKAGIQPAIQPLSPAQLAANQTNSQLSTGPRTATGKAISARNSFKHGLTAKTITLNDAEALEYNRQLDSYIASYAPANEEELRLVKSILDCHWRIERSLLLESAVLRKGHAEFEKQFEDEPASGRESLILAEVYLKYERPLRNLHIQEARLRRTREKETAELHRLQSERRQAERLAAEEAAQCVTNKPQPRPATMATANGFVFSTPENLSQPQQSAAPSSMHSGV